MRFKLSLLAALVLLALPAAASATPITYNSNNLSGGQNVCSVTLDIFQGGGKFNSVINTTTGNGQCTINAGQGTYVVTVFCQATVAHADGSPSSNTGLGNCPKWALVNESFVHWGGTARFRTDLVGTPYLWNCNAPIGTACFTDAEQGAYDYTCTVGAAHKVKDCTFRRDV